MLEVESLSVTLWSSKYSLVSKLIGQIYSGGKEIK